VVPSLTYSLAGLMEGLLDAESNHPLERSGSVPGVYILFYRCLECIIKVSKFV